MVSKGQFVGLDWNRITRLRSQVMIGTQEVKNSLRVGVVGVVSGRKRNILAARFGLWFLMSVLP